MKSMVKKVLYLYFYNTCLPYNLEHKIELEILTALDEGLGWSSDVVVAKGKVIQGIMEYPTVSEVS